MTAAAAMESCEQSVPTHHEPRVRFSETSEMVLIADLSQGLHMHKLWFTQQELNLIKANNTCYVQVVRMHISTGHEPTASNILGMEKFLTAQLTEEYKIRRREHTDTVLVETRRQLVAARCGTPLDIDRLSIISSEGSKWARERASAAALFLEHKQEAGIQREMHRRRTPVARQNSNDNSAINRRQYVRRASLQETKRFRNTPSESPMETDAQPRLTRITSPSPV